ncbi:MAG: TIGR04552 family protein [Bdellovibrionales bacterium]|nr:TIGR04552 family protein [Bdellovibrionales bacterium]
MNFNYRFDVNMLESLVGGLSVLDIHNLKIQNLDQAHSFIKTYGYDINKAADEKLLWNYYRRAVTYINTELLNEEESIPESLADPNKLQSIANLLIYASVKDQRENSIQRWACAILKVMHVLVHLDNDLFNQYSTKIQDQILEPIKKYLVSDSVSGTYLGNPSDPESIPLKKFIVKPYKSSTSSITKLLAKPDAVAFTILDKIGVRFVTKHLFDVFRVMRFMMDHHIISFPHNIPDQSNNTLYPTNLFLEVMESFPQGSELTVNEIDKILDQKLQEAKERAMYREKLNLFSSKNYSFVKFITRRLIRIELPQEGNEKNKELNFFYPYEVQIVDYETYLKNLSGEASHEEYKKRQRQRARLRVLGHIKC